MNEVEQRYSAEMSRVFAEMLTNKEVRMQDINKLSTIGIPAISLAISLVDSEAFVGKVNDWFNNNKELYEIPSRG